jgi:hypothetical protein
MAVSSEVDPNPTPWSPGYDPVNIEALDGKVYRE